MTHPARGSQTKHGCIIMASGLGTRFGGNKLMTELGGADLVGDLKELPDGVFHHPGS